MDLFSIEKNRIWVPVLFIFLSVTESFHRLVQIWVGYLDIFVDAKAVWIPVSHAVLNGVPLYMGTAVDNKPPLWQFLNIIVASTGHYVSVFTIFVGVFNGLSAALLWRYLRDNGFGRAGLVAGILYLAAIPVIQGRVINVRSFAVIGILVAVQTRNSFFKGIGVSAAALLSQYGALAAVPILWNIVHENQRPMYEGLMFIIAGLLSVVLSYGFVLALWGPESLIAAIQHTIMIGGQYATEATKYTIMGTPLIWGGGILKVILGTMFVMFPAVISFRYSLHPDSPKLLLDLAMLSGFLALPLAIRSFQVYWIYPMPFLAASGAIGYELFFTRDVFSNRSENNSSDTFDKSGNSSETH